MIPKDSITRASLENLAAINRVSSLANIPRPSSSSKKQKENENTLSGNQFQQSQIQLQTQKTMFNASANSLSKQQVVINTLPLGYNQNIQNSNGTLTQRGKDVIINEPSNVIMSNGIAQQKQNLSTVTAPNSCQNTARNLSQNNTTSSKISSNGNINSARATSQRQISQPSPQVITMCAANLLQSQQNQIQLTIQSQRNNGNIQQINASNQINNTNINGNQNQVNSAYSQSTTKNLREILQSSTTKQNHILSHRAQNYQANNQQLSQKLVTDENFSNQTQSSSSKRVLTTPSTIGGTDESYIYKDINQQKKDLLRMSLQKQTSISSSSSNNGTILNSCSNKGNNDIQKQNQLVSAYKPQNLDKNGSQTNLQQSCQGGIGNSSLLLPIEKLIHEDKINTIDKINNFERLSIQEKIISTENSQTTVKKTKKNGNFYNKEIKYYRQREIEYLQKIQKLEKENKRVTQIVQKSDSDMNILRSEIVAFSQRYNLQNSTLQDEQVSTGRNTSESKLRAVTPDNKFKIQSDQNINNNTQSIHISDLLNDYNLDNIQQIEYTKNQEKINLLQSYSTSLEQKLKQLEQNIQQTQSSQGTTNGKHTQSKEVMNNCYKILEQKYISLYQKTKQQKSESDDIFKQINFYLQELNKDPSQISQQKSLHQILPPNTSNQISVLKALAIGKQLSQLNCNE